MDSNKIAFREAEFANRDDGKKKIDVRVAFMQTMLLWMATFTGEFIDTFEICFAKPVGFETELRTVIEFAVSKKFKNLILDFSIPDEKSENVVELPDSVYELPNLESVKLFACRFDPTRFTNAGSFKTLCFGYTHLGKISSLLSTTPLLESLTITNCWNVGLEKITEVNNRLTELVILNTNFSVVYSTLDLPNIEVFKYVGEIHWFDFDRVNRNMEEAYLDFEHQTEYDDSTGDQLSGLLYNLLSAKKLTVCPFLIQTIQESDNPVKLQAPMETTHLVIKTNLNPSEFVGIRLMINSCPALETLTFEMIPQRAIIETAPGLRFDPDKYWTAKLSHECVKKCLRFVEIKGFAGGVREAQVMQYLLGYGRKLEMVDLHVANGLSDGEKIVARATSELIGKKFYRGSSLVKVYLHQDGEEILEV